MTTIEEKWGWEPGQIRVIGSPREPEPEESTPTPVFDSFASLGLRARATVAVLELFGFNPGQLRGPDGRFIKMGGRGSAGKGGLPKGSGRASAAVEAGDSTGYSTAEITDTQHRGVTKYDFTPKAGGRTRDVTLLPPEGRRWADVLSGPPGDTVLSQGHRGMNKKDKTLYGRMEMSVADDGSATLRFGPAHETRPEETTVELTPTEATRLSIKLRSNADRDERELEASRAPKPKPDSAAVKRRKEGLALLERVNTLARQTPDFEMDAEELDAAYQAIDTDSPFAVEAVDKLRRMLGQYEGNVPGAILPGAPPAVDAHGVVEGTRAAELRDAQTERIRASRRETAAPDTGPSPVGFTPRSDAEWNLAQKRLGKRTARTDPEGDLQPGDIVPTRDGKWQEVLRPDPSKFWERNGTQGWMVRDDAKGYVHGEGANTIRQQIERYAAEKAWRDAGGSKDRLDGVAQAPVAPTGRRPGEPPIGEDGKYAKPTKQYAVWDGKTYTRTSRNPYRYASVVSAPNPDGTRNTDVWSWHQSYENAAQGVLTASQKRGGIRVQQVVETGFEPPAAGGPEINANGPVPASATRAQVTRYNQQLRTAAGEARDAAFDDGPARMDAFQARALADRLEAFDRAQADGDVAAQDRLATQIRELLLHTGALSETELPTKPGS